MEVGETAQDARGYATVLSESQQVEQQRMLERHVADSDVVITTAAVPGQPAPRLIPASVVEEMRAGSVIVDLAAESGGNCELTEAGQVVERHGVTLIGTLNLPSGMPLHASQMYARNIQAVLEHLVVDGTLTLDFDDEITADAIITHDGTRDEPPSPGSDRVNESLLIELTVFVLAAFVGIELISKVPTTLHTPLMTGTNAIHGDRHRGRDPGRRLRPGDADQRCSARSASPSARRTSSVASWSPTACCTCSTAGRERARRMSRADAIGAAYLIAASLFIIGLKRLSSPADGPVAATRSRLSAWRSRSSAMLFDHRVVTYGGSSSAPSSAAIGGAIGARRVKMTAMPQMVALFNGFGGGAAALVALADYHDTVGAPGHVEAKIIVSILFSAVVGSVSFAGSMIAFGKLQDDASAETP